MEAILTVLTAFCYREFTHYLWLTIPLSSHWLPPPSGGDLVIYKKYVFDHLNIGLHLQFLAHSYPNLWNFLRDESIKASLVIKRGDFWKAPKIGSWLPGESAL